MTRTGWSLASLASPETRRDTLSTMRFCWTSRLAWLFDDYSRKVLAWTLSPTMTASDVTETLDLARAATPFRSFPLRGVASQE